MAKKVVTFSLNDAVDQRVDEIAAENVDLVGRNLYGDPNRSEVLRALIATYDRERLRAYLAQQREQPDRAA